MLEWLFSVFVMTPFAIVQSTLSWFLLYRIPNFSFENTRENALTEIIVAAVALLIVTLIVCFIRFGTEEGTLYFIWELLVSPIRLPLILITNIVAFVGIFSGAEIDAREEPDIDEHGFFGSILVYLLHIIPEKRQKKRLSFPAARRKYKIKVIFTQLLTLALTFVHSVFGIFIMIQLVPESLIGFIIAIFVYLLTSVLSAMLKGLTTDFTYYDPVKIDKVEIEQPLWYDDRVNQWVKDGDAREKSRKTIHKPGVKTVFTPQMIFYFIFGWLIFFNQALVFLLSIIIPQSATYHPCMLDDCPPTLGARILYFFFGIAKC